MIKIGPLNFRKDYIMAIAEEFVEEPTEMTKGDGSPVTIERRAVRYFPVAGRAGAVKLPGEYDLPEAAKRAGLVPLGEKVFVDPRSVVMAVFDNGTTESGKKVYGFQIVLETGQPLQGPCTPKQEQRFLTAWKKSQEEA